MYLSPDTVSYLEERASHYDGDASSMLAITPPVLDTDAEIVAFWQSKHLSHVQSQDNAPHLADDWSNIIPEDANSNLQRGCEDITKGELASIAVDNLFDAAVIELCH